MKIEHIVLLVLIALLLFGFISLKVLAKEKWESSYRGQHWFQGIFLSAGAVFVILFAVTLLSFYDANRSAVRKSECRSRNLSVLVDSNYTQKEIADILGAVCK